MMSIEQLAIEHELMVNIELYGEFKDNEMLLKARREKLKKLEAFAKALQQQSEPVAKPDAWLVPMILDFTEAKKVHFTRSEKGKDLTDDELKAELQGTVIWRAETVYINDSNEPIIDSNGVRHYAKPLFTNPHVQSCEPVAEHSKYISHLWEMIGRWSAYLASNGDDANLAPPDYLIDAIKNATQPPNTVSLEQYNKLLDALNEYAVWEIVGRGRTKIPKNNAAQAIAEAERSAK